MLAAVTTMVTMALMMEIIDMHYYQFNIKTYHAATSHLSPHEDLTYRRALDYYYDTELPIPDDIPKMARRLRVSEDALTSILHEFFHSSDRGWRHEHCDSEIAAFHSQKARNSENGKKGGRPKKRTKTDPLQVVKPNESEVKGNKEQVTSNNYPITTNNKKTGRKRPVSVDWEEHLLFLGCTQQVATDWLAVRHAKKSPLSFTALALIQTEADKAGITMAQAITIACGNGWRGFKADWLNKPMTQSATTFIADHTDRSWADSFIAKHTDPTWREGLI